jgi:hypothetical protein
VLGKQLVWLTGKGGVGRTTVAAALALVASGRGRRGETIVCEVGAQERLPRLFGVRGGGGREVRLRPGLSAVSIDPQAALREWLAGQLPGPLSRILGDSRTFNYFYAAAPGARELVTMLKVWELTQTKRWDKQAPTYDLVIVDAPATGHALGMLRTPRTFGDIARVGPLRGQADRIEELLLDPRRSAFAAATSAADMPVNETFFLQDKLRAALGRKLDLIVANGVYPVRFSADELAALESAANGNGLARAASAAATSQAARVGVQQEQLARLREGARGEIVELPYVFAPELDLKAVAGLAAELEGKV